ncbi:Cof-type HAD-IIB family hydrolase [Phormidium sp. FACHB-1136]|uniref:Cof-type HAD-IIB family hydrolase n=1 Tax=Phormidium sp. FACHB-1136 TaxID=2692848 RepID=UPI0016860F61|nr:Cof-type HAD-IIB family hydrolase [Phormidium sp. FACHB-1136]MBD2424995.1 HAD family phosphatase [Phormidium sp. FACHB-1136]
MAKDIRLLVLDIDGTLAGESNQISPRVLTAIQEVQGRGIAVAIATGRMYQAALRFHQAVESTLPLMAYQGAFIKCPRTDTLHRHTPLPRALALDLLAYLAPMEAQQDLSIHLYIDDQLHVRAVIEDTQAYAERSGVDPLAVGDLATLMHRQNHLETTKLLALSGNTALISQILADLEQRYASDDLYLTRSVDYFVEATHPLANKGEAVRFVAEDLLDLKPDQVMTVGDNFNDLEMLRYAGVGVAMGEAPIPVQQAADWVAPGVEEDGVAVAIEQFLL